MESIGCPCAKLLTDAAFSGKLHSLDGASPELKSDTTSSTHTATPTRAAMVQKTDAIWRPIAVFEDPRMIVAQAAVLSQINSTGCHGATMVAAKRPRAAPACSFSEIPELSLNRRGVWVEITVCVPSCKSVTPRWPAPHASGYTAAGLVVAKKIRLGVWHAIMAIHHENYSHKFLGKGRLPGG